MRLLTAVIALAVGLGCNAWADSRTPPAAAARATAATGLRLQRATLANGLETLLLRDPAAPMVGVFAVIRAGLRHERPGEDGLSHFLEHLLFNGTTTMSQEQLYAAVDRMGAYSNATTRSDHTVFQMLVPRAELAPALAIQASMLFRSTLPAEKYEKERGIVLEEIAKDAATPSTPVEEAFRAWAWEGTALARPVIGSPLTLKSIPREAVLAYWKRRYVPANTTVLVVGDVSAEELGTMIERAYGDLPAAGMPLPEPAVRMPAHGRALRTMAAGLETLDLLLAFSGPDPAHPDVWALEVLGSLLSSGPGPSLEKSLRERGFAGATGSAALERAGGATAFVVRASVATGSDPRALLGAVVDAAATAATRATADDLRSVRTRLAVAEAFLAEKPHYFGLEKSSLLVNGGAGAIEGEGPAHAAVELEPLRDTSLRWLSSGPFRALAAGKDLAAATIELGVGDAGGETAGRARPTRLTRTLANGVRLSVASNPGAGVFAAHVLRSDRSLAEGPEGRGLGDLTQRLLPRRGEDFERSLAAIGAVLKTTDDPAIPFDDYYDLDEYAYLRLETTDAFASEGARLLGVLLSRPTFPDADLAAAQQAQLAAIARNEGSSSARSAERLADALYGADASLGRSPRGHAATVSGATRASLDAFAAHWLDPRSLIVTVETGLPAAGALALLETHLSGLAPSSSTDAARARIEPPASVSAPIREELGGKQSYIRLGAAARIPEPERAAFMLAAAVYSERLAADIREKRGQAYSIGAGVTFRPPGLPDAWSASAGTRPENAAAVEAAMLAILRDLVREGPSEEEIALAAARLAGRELMRRLTGIGRAYFAGLDLYRQEAPGTSLGRVESLSAVAPARVRDALRRWFEPARASVVTVK